MEGGGGGEGGGPHVGCRLKFDFFCWLSVTIFDLCRLSVNLSYFFVASR